MTACVRRSDSRERRGPRGAVMSDRISDIGAVSVPEFKGRLRGQLLQETDDGYEEARNVWNGNIDRRPLLIARCTEVADVIEAVNFARAANLLVAVRGGAHNAAGHATCDGGIVIDL